jgi:microcystin-dependent protein
MPILPLRVQQSTSTAGTGTIALNAAAAGRRSFQEQFGTGSSRIAYVISGASFFEIGYGAFDGGSPGTLSRDNVLASSNAGALISLPAGTADVFPFLDPGERGLVSGAGTVTIGLADIGNAVCWTGSLASSLYLPAIASVPPGRGLLVRNGGTAALTIDPNASELINGATTLVLAPTQAVELLRVGSVWAAFHEGGRLVGEWITGGWANPPPRTVWANGQALSRAIYAALFAVYGTTFGAGDGSTSFNVPDLHGRTVIGRDDMGGTAASRVTAAVSGLDGVTLGATGGDQRIPTHTHPVTEAPHSHGVTDPGHTHTLRESISYNNSSVIDWVASGDGGHSPVDKAGVINAASTGVSVNAASTGLTVGANTAGGSSANMPPGLVGNVVIYTGVG